MGMTRRNFLRAAACGAAACAIPRNAAGAQRPNIVLIFTDDQGYNDLGCFGSPDIRTPNIDRLAADGMRFTDFYTASAVCTPSRAALMTGCYPMRNSMATFPRKNRSGAMRDALVLFPDQETIGLNPDEITIADMLKDTGYATGCVGKWHLGHRHPFLPTDQGFDYYFGIPYSNDMTPAVVLRNDEVVEEEADQDTLTVRYTEEATRFIREHSDEPFFLYMPHSMPHTPLHVADQFRDQSERGLYGDVIEMVDWSVGQIMKTLDEQGLADNTLIVFTSDNGPWLVKGDHGGSADPLRAGKNTVYEGGQRVPCVMRWPGVIPAGTACSEIASTIDLLPTFAALCGADAPQDRVIDGHDIRALMRGEPGARSPHDAFYFYKGDSLEAVRSGPWKLVFERSKGAEWPYGGGENRKSVVSEALFNLERDVEEQYNVIDRYPGLANRLRALADRMREDVGDGRLGITGKRVRPLGRA